VPSGVTAVIMATIPVFIATAEILLLRTQRLTVQLGGALVIGLAGVAALMSRSLNLGGEPISTIGATALIVASIFWSVASVLTRKLPLPPSKVLSAGAQMLVGGAMLAVISAALGDMRGFRASAISGKAWFALVYLIVMGSIVGFTAYVWLISHESPTKVGTYAYVNPLVAVLLGYFVAGEPLGLRTVLGTVLVLASVLLITLGKLKRKSVKTIEVSS
jgi:drug/metabolite transporter (DMT)-like permease